MVVVVVVVVVEEVDRHFYITCNFIYKRTRKSAKAKSEAKAESQWIMTFEFY